MSGSLHENPLRRDSRSCIVELAQHVHQQDIQNIPRPVLSVRSRASMKLLGHLR